MFATLGVRVTLIEKRAKLLEFADQEIVEALSYHLRDSRVTMRLGEEVESVEELPDGTVVANLRKQEEGLRRRAALCRRPPGHHRRPESRRRRHRGRRPRAHPRGRELPAPSVEHIFAVGDVIGFPSLASVSMEQGRIAAARAFNDKAHVIEPQLLSLRHLHHSRDQLHRQDRGAADRRRCALRSGHGLLSRDRARPDSRRHHRPPEADLPPRHAQGARRAHHRRRRQRTGAHRPGGDGARTAPSNTSSTRSSTIQPWPSATRRRRSTGSAACTATRDNHDACTMHGARPAHATAKIRRAKRSPRRENDNRNRRRHDRTHRCRAAGGSCAWSESRCAIPQTLDEVDALTVLPVGELLEILANQITELAGKGEPD